MIYILALCMVVLFVAAVLVLVRLTRGPSSLERMVAVDFMTSVLIGAVAVLAALTRREDLLALFVALSLIGFVGSMTLARFILPVDQDAKRILTRDEERRHDAALAARNDDAAPVHDVDADMKDVTEAGPMHGGATAVERRTP
ncbi:monovalent cation/H+ antiporter complex subunit F [Trueperella pyogenes]|uniref:monovalent cation/H+ antiporter complex subunit F n=1 Tax=Trueperella pyogenes TaxID=1661 RepID=UPI00345DB021